ncbi:LysR family transcriptional regulator [Pseudomonas matsuisoli]|uniref:Transcriptional regulator n=1 Tax=Pseudomonas matsuisoli TaxID=1515666 RepID=A0A917UX69_9PSED|nr:LysR family transcriptional regulator [Pseudomonas matsuisoli]GGJ91816.1 transcriptional regulator [Pseudomonas matsuisoli]
MTLKQVRAFLAVAQSLSFAQACERLHLSQPALSLTIKTLEESLGGRLFSRSTRAVALTPEGEALLPLARRLVADWENTEDQMRQRFTLQQGRVSLAAMPSFACNPLPDILTAFRERYPQINITVHDVINEQVGEMVRDRRVELGVGFEPEPSSGLAFTPLYVDRFVAAVPSDSPLRDEAVVTWDQLMAYPFITLQRPSAVRFLLEESYRISVAFECHQLVTVGRMVASGLGVSAVPSLCIGQMQSLGAHCIPLRQPVVEKPIGLLTQPHHELSVAAQALFDTLISVACDLDEGS